MADHFDFMRLPAEIRSDVFDSLFKSVIVRYTDNHFEHSNNSKSNDYTDSVHPCLSVSKSFSGEAKPRWYRHATFQTQNTSSLLPSQHTFPNPRKRTIWLPRLSLVEKMVIECSAEDLEKFLDHIGRNKLSTSHPWLKHLRINVNCWHGDAREMLHGSRPFELEMMIAIRFTMRRDPIATVYIDSNKGVVLFQRCGDDKSKEYLKKHLALTMNLDADRIKTIEDDYMAKHAIEILGLASLPGPKIANVPSNKVEADRFDKDVNKPC